MSKYNIELRPLDIVLYPPNTFLGKIISFFEGPKCHAGILLKIKNRIVQFEAFFPKIDVIPLSSNLIENPAKGVAVRRHPLIKNFNNYELQMLNDKVLDFAFKTWGLIGYNVTNLLTFPLATLFGWDKNPDIKETEIPDKMICSELVSYVYRKFALVDICPSIRDKYTSPSNIYKSKSLITITEDLKFTKEPRKY